MYLLQVGRFREGCIITVSIRARNEGPRGFHNHGEGPYKGNFLVKATRNVLKHMVSRCEIELLTQRS